jgi:hypothetical protein
MGQGMADNQALGISAVMMQRLSKNFVLVEKAYSFMKY